MLFLWKMIKMERFFRCAFGIAAGLLVCDWTGATVKSKAPREEMVLHKGEGAWRKTPRLQTGAPRDMADGAISEMGLTAVDGAPARAVAARDAKGVTVIPAGREFGVGLQAAGIDPIGLVWEGYGIEPGPDDRPGGFPVKGDLGVVAVGISRVGEGVVVAPAKVEGGGPSGAAAMDEKDGTRLALVGLTGDATDTKRDAVGFMDAGNDGDGVVLGDQEGRIGPEEEQDKKVLLRHAGSKIAIKAKCREWRIFGG
jgi:hypothetical protein